MQMHACKAVRELCFDVRLTMDSKYLASVAVCTGAVLSHFTFGWLVGLVGWFGWLIVDICPQ